MNEQEIIKMKYQWLTLINPSEKTNSRVYVLNYDPESGFVCVKSEDGEILPLIKPENLRK